MRLEKSWKAGGWWIMLTLGKSWGLGFVVCGGGTDIYCGNLVLTIVSPNGSSTTSTAP